MPSSEFAPLAGEAPRRPGGFHPLAMDEPAAGGEAATESVPAVDEAAVALEAELRRAFEAGYAEGRASRDEEIATCAANTRAALEQVAALRGTLRGRYEHELVALAIEVARTIVREEVAAQPERWLGMIREGIRQTVDRERVVVRVAPELGAFLRDADPPLAMTVDDVRTLEIVDDPSVGPGGCILDVRYGEVDLGIDAQIETCARAVLGEAAR